MPITMSLSTISSEPYFIHSHGQKTMYLIQKQAEELGN